MKLLVTGGYGFIGSNFIYRCLQTRKNVKIINIDAMVTGSNLLNLKNLKKSNYQFVKGNICDKKIMKKLINEVDVIINFAAESHVDRSISNSKKFIQANFMGVYNILEILREAKNTKFLQISTDEVYGDISKGSFKENDKLTPSNPYSATKASAEMMIKSYVRTYDLDIMISRCVNNYGPRQFPEKLIPRTILSALNNKSIPLHGDGKARRQWIHVTDHCDAILKILSNWKKSSVYNISSNLEKSNIDVVNTILSMIGKPKSLITFVRDRPGQDKRYAINSSLLKKDVGFQPKIGFEKGLESTINWYIENKTWRNNTVLRNIKDTPWLN